jgi:hypothetical protein
MSYIDAKQPDVNSGDDLTALADQIRNYHQQAVRAVGQALEHAMNAGDALLKAKARQRHGNWASWLRKNCEISPRTAQRYMQLAEARTLLQSKSVAVATHLTIAQALKLLGNKKLPHRKSERRSPQSTSLSSIAWAEASDNQRQHFLEEIGLSTLVEAMPPAWRAQFAKHVKTTPFALGATDKLRTALRCAEQQKPDEEGFRYMAAALGCIVRAAEKNGISRSNIVIGEGKARKKLN